MLTQSPPAYVSAAKTIGHRHFFTGDDDF